MARQCLTTGVLDQTLQTEHAKHVDIAVRYGSRWADEFGLDILRHEAVHSDHIGVGRTHTRTHVLVLVHDRDIRIVNAATGELLRELVRDPTKRYHGTGRPPRPTR